MSEQSKRALGLAQRIYDMMLERSLLNGVDDDTCDEIQQELSRLCDANPHPPAASARQDKDTGESDAESPDNGVGRRDGTSRVPIELVLAAIAQRGQGGRHD